MGSGYKYLSIYDFDTDRPKDVQDAISARASTDAMPLSDALDQDNIFAIVYEPITPLIEVS